MTGSRAGTGGMFGMASGMGVKANRLGVLTVLAAGVFRSGNGGGSMPSLATSLMSIGADGCRPSSI